MKKSKLIIAIMAISMCLIMALAGCNNKNEESGEDLSAVFQKSNYKERTPIIYTSVSDLNYDGYSINRAKGEFVCFQKVEEDKTTFKIYNLRTGKEIASYTAETVTEESGKETIKNYDFSFKEIELEEDVSFFIVCEETGFKEAAEDEYTYTYKVSFIDAAGTVIASKIFDDIDEAGSVLDYENAEDLVVFFNSLYRVSKDGSFNKVSDNYGNGLAGKSIPNNIIKSGEYYYSQYSYDSDYMVTVYDLNLNAKCYYQAPSYARDITHGILQNGNIFIQYVIPRTPYDEYDIIMDGQYYNLKQMIVNVEDGSVSDVEIGYYIDGVYSEELEGTGFNPAYLNIAHGYAIENGYVNGNEDVSFVIDNDCSVMVLLENVFIPNEENFFTIAQDRVIVVDKNNMQYLYTFDKQLIGGVNYNAHVGSIGEQYFFDSENIYDVDLNIAFAYKENGYSYYDGYSGGVSVFTKDVTVEEDSFTAYYIFVNGAMKQIAGKDQSVEALTTGLIKIETEITDEDENTVYTYALFNQNGEKIGSDFSEDLYYGHRYDETVLIKTTDNEGVAIYKVVK